MDWIEQVLAFFGINWSPDAGNGTFEQALGAMVVWAPVAVASVALFVTVQRKKIKARLKKRALKKG